MLYQIVSFLLEVAASLLGGACLLRLYMQYHRVPFANPVGRFVFAVTDWLVLPLRAPCPRWADGIWPAWWARTCSSWPSSVCCGCWPVAWLQRAGCLCWRLSAFAQTAISGLTGLLIVYAILSWTQSGSPVSAVIERLCAPLLAPFRNIIPLVGGIDLSPLALLVVLQVAAIVLGAIQHSVLH